jgi:aerobic-type carbon monoxide dehydrogenase small subunit (CoxS/CutS family)
VTGPTVTFTLDGSEATVPASGSLLDALRDHLGVRSAKDGCSPQGQCGCCTVLVDGSPRVACVTPVSRVAGRAVTTVDGLPEAEGWAASFAATGGTQCGFCTPGIILRASALTPAECGDRDAVDRALLAHLCRCTGWVGVVDAIAAGPCAADPGRDLAAAARRAAIEGGTDQRVGAEIALGRGGFAADTAPPDALVAVPAGDGTYVVGETLAEARARSGKVQGRRTTAALRWPLEVPAGDWVRTLRTTWVEPAYLEPDAAWCVPGGEPVSALGNGGAFGGKVHAEVEAVARRLADEHGRPVLVQWSREDVVRSGPKRPPLAAGVRADGTGIVHVARTPGIAAAITAVAPGLEVVEVDVPGPPTSTALRAAGWAEALVLLAAAGDVPVDRITAPSGGMATARLDDDGSVHVTVRCGAPLDEVVLRSYATGAAHLALGWVRNEGIAVDDDGIPLDLTIRSFGVLRAVDTPAIHVTVEPDDGPPVNGSDAVFAAVALAAWRHAGFPAAWPCAR